jgi:hypothetical protein
LPQELRLNGITNYADANRYLQEHFIADFNRRFTVAPAQKESAFTKLPGIELDLVLSAKHQRVVRNDNTVVFQNLILQLPTTRQRIHFVRCPVTVHQFANATLGVSYQGRLLARYDSSGGLLAANSAPNKVRATAAQRPDRPNKGRPSRCNAPATRLQNPHFFARTPKPAESAGEKMSSAFEP